MLSLLLGAAALCGLSEARGLSSAKLDVRIPGVQAESGDLYLCTSVPVEEAAHIVGFQVNTATYIFVWRALALKHHRHGVGLGLKALAIINTGKTYRTGALKPTL